MLLLPDFYFANTTDVNLGFLRKHHIKAVLLDIDNTLTQHNGTEPYSEVREWVRALKNAEIKVAIISNTSGGNRVRLFAEKLGIDNYIWKAKKPSKKGFLQLIKELEVDRSEAVVIGDQIFTDILGANRVKALSILVDARDKNEPILVKIKRVLEVPFRRLIKFEFKK